MKRTGIILFGYIVYIFILQTLSVFVPAKAANLYLSLAIIAMGMAAILCQKFFNRGKFLDMGFRLNRRAAAGVVTGVIFTAAIIALHYWLPYKMGVIRFDVNAAAGAPPSGISAAAAILIGSAVLFPPVLFGEELTFRGYILPKFEEISGPFKAVIFSCAVFALWHLPAYYSVYSGGAAAMGWDALSQMLLGHFITAIPICILYMTTRELYGVSVYHALADVFQYSVVSAGSFGEASKNAVYLLNVVNAPAFESLTWLLYFLDILIMLLLCLILKKMRLAASANYPPSVTIR